MRWSGSASVTLLAAGIVIHGTAHVPGARAGSQTDGGARTDGPKATDAAKAADGGAAAAAASWMPAAESLRLRAAAFSRFRTPVRGSAEAVGAYANGCVMGAAALPPSGKNYEVLHLQRHRSFGHPALLAYIKRLAAAAKQQGVGPLLIGDLSQPRGGPTPNGHRSHQTGLDVDIGFTRQPWLLKRRPTASEREELMPPAVVDLKTRTLTSAWGPKVEKLIELAARDGAVERVFVNPHVKAALCKKTMRDRSWLRVIRPWTFHHDHLHVRLKCPPGSSSCEAQAAVAQGDGCDEADRWIADELRRLQPQPPPTEPRPPPPPPPPPPPLPPMPAACQALLDAPPAPPTSARGRRAARDP
jgi:penicillin-insensitive murein endopeptidase